MCVFANMSDCTPAPEGTNAFETFAIAEPVDFVVLGDAAAADEEEDNLVQARLFFFVRYF